MSIMVKEFNGYAWYRNGKLHREDGPARELYSGTKMWYQNGERHRENGPAYEGINGDQSWYINDVIHRLDGPASIYSNGSKYWLQNGKQHRENGPAVEVCDGTKHWFRHGIRHRIDGPATIYVGPKYGKNMIEWWIDDKILTAFAIKNHQIDRLQSLTITFLQLERLPPYVILWILEWSECAYIFELNPRSVIKMIEGIRNSRYRIKEC